MINATLEVRKSSNYIWKGTSTPWLCPLRKRTASWVNAEKRLPWLPHCGPLWVVFERRSKARKQKHLTWWQWCTPMKTSHPRLSASEPRWPGQGSPASGRRTRRSRWLACRCPGSVVHLPRGLLPTRGTILFLESPCHVNQQILCSVKKKGRRCWEWT